MKNWWGLILVIITASFASLAFHLTTQTKMEPEIIKPVEKHWFMLHRKSSVEYFYIGEPGNKDKSKLLKTFKVKTGMPGERPTPLPQLVGREYWLLTKKASSAENPETAPYFLTLNIPGWEEEPYGPTPYTECIDPLSGEQMQCHWNLPGEFGLHGVNGDESRLSAENPGSSGCVRHTDADITYLFNTLDPQNEEIRYYIQDS